MFSPSTFVINDGSLPKITPVTADSYSGQVVNYQTGNELIRKTYIPRSNFYRKGGRAIVLGNGKGRSRLSLAEINHSNRNKRLAFYNIIYGCNNAFLEEGDLDYLIVTNQLVATQIPKDLHASCYTNQEIQRVFQNMEIIPLNQRLDAGSAAAMTACFHGADKVFLLGFDGQERNSKNNNIYAGHRFYDDESVVINDNQWQINLEMIMASYSNVTFYRIDANPVNSRRHQRLKNYKLISFQDFVYEADI